MSPRVVAFVPDMPSLGRAVVAIGVFDGVHLGHCELLRQAAQEASSRGEVGIAITFDRDPDQIVTPEVAAPQLLTLDEKLRAIKQCGIEVVLVVPFTCETASMSPGEFLESVLGVACKVSSVHVGRDFRFGTRASGDVEALRAWASQHGADVHAHELLEVDGAPVTSTRIRALVSAGEVEAAAALLDRPTRVTGYVVAGRGEGKKLGFPTANVHPLPYSAIPGDGVYAARVTLEDGTRHDAAVSVGIPPMFPDAKESLEAHLIDFAGHLYDQKVSIEFIARLRALSAFPTVNELVAAITEDVAAARQALAACR